MEEPKLIDAVDEEYEVGDIVTVWKVMQENRKGTIIPNYTNKKMEDYWFYVELDDGEIVLTHKLLLMLDPMHSRSKDTMKSIMKI